MWDGGHFLVPPLHGQVYAQKPPLFFWMIHLGWWLFGVHAWVARLVPSLFALLALLIQEDEKKDAEFLVRFRGRDVGLWRAGKVLQDGNPIMRNFQDLSSILSHATRVEKFGRQIFLVHFEERPIDVHRCHFLRVRTRSDQRLIP